MTDQDRAAKSAAVVIDALRSVASDVGIPIVVIHNRLGVERLLTTAFAEAINLAAARATTEFADAAALAVRVLSRCIGGDVSPDDPADLATLLEARAVLVRAMGKEPRNTEG